MRNTNTQMPPSAIDFRIKLTERPLLYEKTAPVTKNRVNQMLTKFD